MAAVERSVTPSASRKQGMGRPAVFWAMLTSLLLLLVAAVTAGLAWRGAEVRAQAQTARIASLQAAQEGRSELEAHVAALRHDLTQAQAHAQLLQAALDQTQAALNDAKAGAAAAQQRVDAAQDRANSANQAAAEAEQARAELQAQQDAIATADAPPAARVIAPQPASNTPAGANAPEVAPVLPLAGLPANASARDYLVAAQQAAREGRGGRAQSALEHAETRLLNRLSDQHDLGRPASHPGVTEIEQALAQLGNGRMEEATRTIDGLLSTR